MTRTEPDHSASFNTGSREASASPAPSVFGDLSTAFQSGQATPPLGAGGPRRRGSMVGYIEDPVVSSKVRVRFDIGRHSHTPDRAEFFYAKCGCYRDLARTDPAYDPNAAGPGPGIVSDLNFQQSTCGEYAATARFSAFAELRCGGCNRRSSDAFANQSGLGDLAAGVRIAVAADRRADADRPGQDVSPERRFAARPGHQPREHRTGCLTHQQISDRAAVESQFALWLPFGGSDGVPTSVEGKFAGNILSYGIGPLRRLQQGRRAVRSGRGTGGVACAQRLSDG